MKSLSLLAGFALATGLTAPAAAQPGISPATETVLARCADLAQASGMTPGEKAVLTPMIRGLGEVQLATGIGFPPEDAAQMCTFYSYFVRGQDAAIADGACETRAMNGTINFTLCKRNGSLAFDRAWPVAAP